MHRRQTTTRKTTTKKKKYKRRKKAYRYKIVRYEIDDKTGKKIAIKERVRRYTRRKNTRKTKTKKSKARKTGTRAKQVVAPKTVKTRLAHKLGICPPKRPGQTLPDVRISNTSNSFVSQRHAAAISGVDLFGQRNELDYFSGSDDEMEGTGINIMVARRPTMADATAARRIARRKRIALEIQSGPTDVLGSILDMQSKLHSKNSVLSVDKDGSVQVNVKDGRSISSAILQAPLYYNNNSSSSNISNSNGGSSSANNGTYSYESSVPTSTVRSYYSGGSGYGEPPENEGPQDYSIRRICGPSEKKEKKEEQPGTSGNAPYSPSADSEVDIYSDIETVSTSRQDETEKYSTMPVVTAQTFADDENNESDTDLVIDTEKADQDKYDPAAALSTDSEDNTKEELVTSTVGLRGALASFPRTTVSTFR